MAPDSKRPIGLPPGPFGSRIAGILPLGLSDWNSGVKVSFFMMLTACASYGRSPISSSAIEIFTPLGVGNE